MKKYPVLQIGDPKLKRPNKKVLDLKSKKLQDLLDILIHTMQEGGLIGIAAPQIGINKTFFVTEPRQTETRPKNQSDELRVYINPKITNFSEETVEIYEGCGSVLNGQLFAPVVRPKTITVEAYDRQGKKFILTCDVILARVIQHEYDHLSGVEFTEKISDYSKIMSRDWYIKLIKKNPKYIEASQITQKEYIYI